MKVILECKVDENIWCSAEQFTSMSDDEKIEFFMEDLMELINGAVWRFEL